MATDLLGELLTLTRSLDETALLYRRQLDLTNPTLDIDLPWAEQSTRMLDRASRHKTAVLDLMTNLLPRESSDVERLETLLEKHQDIAAQLDRLIARTDDRKLLERLRTLLIDTLDAWDAVVRRLEHYQTPQTEQRRRVRMRTLGDLIITDVRAEEHISGRCLDVSPDGLSALVGEDLPIGTAYALEFRIMGAREPARATGEVRWSRRRAQGDTWRVGFQLRN